MSVTRWLGFALFHGSISAAKMLASSSPTANVIGPIPLADGAVPPDGVLPGAHPAATRTAAIAPDGKRRHRIGRDRSGCFPGGRPPVPPGRATRAVAAAIIARLMLITSPTLGSPRFGIHSCYAQALCTCQRAYTKL